MGERPRPVLAELALPAMVPLRHTPAALTHTSFANSPHYIFEIPLDEPLCQDYERLEVRLCSPGPHTRAVPR